MNLFKIALYIVVVFVSIFKAIGQTSSLPVYTITKDTSVLKIDSSYFEILDNPSQSLTFAQAQQAAGFYQTQHIDPAKNLKSYWLRLKIKNTLNTDKKWWIYVGRKDFMEVYWRPENGNWHHQVTGRLLPESQRFVVNNYRDPSKLPVDIAPNTVTTIYLKASLANWMQSFRKINLYVEQEESLKDNLFRGFYIEKEWREILYIGIMIGVLLIAALISLLMFFAIKDNTYVFFAISLVFYMIDRSRDIIQKVLFVEYPLQFYYVSNFFFGIYLLFFIKSIQTLLQSHTKAPKLNQLLNYTLWFSIIFSTIVEMVYIREDISKVIRFCSELSIRLVFVVLIVMNIKIIKQGFALAKITLIAIMPIFIVWVVSLIGYYINTFGSEATLQATPIILQDFYGIQLYLENFCFAWLSICILGVLVQKYNSSKKLLIEKDLEKEQLEKEREIEKQKILTQQNELLEKLVDQRTAELKASQAQLIQAEKLASLGELTAGIAHEIQNPLNFVNNFAEVSKELVAELYTELPANMADSTSSAGGLMIDLTQNLEKINHHGKRAASIVKGMLEHSRTSTGEKTNTDINALADEYLRLSYHGMRAKDKNFNAEFELIADPNLPSINAIPQDIGRVLLNLMNNGFYAARQKAVVAGATNSATKHYPKVTVSTKKLENTIKVFVKDNGIGMSEEVKAKIFQPFFTTKPTGEGTGLGLSLSYDIITKGHGGTWEVESAEGLGTTFVITLPY